MTPSSAVGDKAPRLAGTACAELTKRLWAGEDCRAEDFLAPEPLADADIDAALELIYTEFVVREELGQQPSPAVWLSRFPQWRNRLERMLQIGALFDDFDELLVDESLPERMTVPESVASASEELPATRDLGPPAKKDTPPTDPDPWLDQYELLEKIGHGGMGVVYRARQLALNRIVALKAIRAGQNAAPDQRARFRREAENMARLRHPNIVPVYAVGERDGCPFFSMEFVEGGNLTRKIAGQPQPERDAARWVEVLARAVHYAHQQGLVHRDLKPSNVVLTTDGVPKITDFGLAKFLGGEPTAAANGGAESAGLGARRGTAVPESDTITGMTIGTPAYMAPEQAAGNTRDVGPLSDVYALGAILYELLTGRPPFSSNASQQTLEDVQEREPPLPHSLNPDVDATLEAVCLKCLKKRPADRYASAEALADDLAQWLKAKPDPVRSLPPWHARVRHWLRRHPLVAMGAMLATLAAAMTATVALHHPASPLDTIERTLAEGRPVTLIGDNGPPAWYQVPLNRDDATVSSDGCNVFTVASDKWAMVELLSRVNVRSYSFRVDVRHDQSDGRATAEVGIYFAHSQPEMAQADKVHFIYGVGFNDCVDIGKLFPKPPIRGNPVQMFRQQLKQPDGEELTSPVRHGRVKEKLDLWFTPVVRDPTIDPWRTLRVTVTPRRIQAFWGDKPLLRSDRAATKDSVSPGELKGVFAPGGALGVYVYHGLASFRRAIVEPLGDDN